MRKMIIAGNWKMNTLPDEGVKLASDIVKSTGSIDSVTTLLCPPATHLAQVNSVIAGSKVKLGAQNVHWAENGAFTGELSASMLRAVGCEWAIIGHSERRQWFCETDQTVNNRLKMALQQGLNCIVCVGETLDELESGRAYAVIEAQVKTAVRNIDSGEFDKIVLAYEPVWAIGTGRNATPKQAQEAHSFIRSLVSNIVSDEIAEKMPIQYGGSVNANNAKELLTCHDVDGALIGGASLKAEVFCEIVKIASELQD